MTKFIVLSLFPEIFEPYINSSIIKRARDKELIDIELINIRDFACNKNNKVDDTPYGGGNGMVMMCKPLDLSIKYALNKIASDDYRLIYMSPKGKLLNYEIASEFSKLTDNYILICGHYEGIDERIINKYNIEQISIGDYVLTGGELPAMVLIDTISRLKPGVLSDGSLNEESHTNVLLEYDQYTKPSNYDGMQVPEVLCSGNFKLIDQYRKKSAIYTTYKNRPDLIKKALKLNLITKDEIKDAKKMNNDKKKGK